MTTKLRVETCAECRFDSGWHYPDDGEPYRPHLDAAKAKERAQAIVEAAHEQQVADARRIVQTAAETKYEFSANDIRQQILDAGIEGPVVGAAFTWCEKQGVIEATGRRVQSSDPATRHAINVWRSRIHPVARRVAS